MSNEKFTLLDRKYPENKKTDIQDERVSALRKQARELREKNNSLVRQLWEIDFKLKGSTISSEDRAKLITKQNTLEQELEEGNYLTRLNTLLDQIKNLEISLYGSSELDSNSPYVL